MTVKDVAELDHLPQDLEELNLGQCPELTTLAGMPEGLSHLWLDLWRPVEEVTTLDSDQCIVKFEGVEIITDLAPLPQGLQKLCLTTPLVSELSGFPVGLQELWIYRTMGEVTIPTTLTKLAVLSLNNCYEVSDLSQLPARLTELSLSGCLKISDLSQLPVGLTQLSISACPEITDFSNLPEGLTTLRLSQCVKPLNLTSLPSNLEDLQIWYCTEQVELPYLPRLTKLVLSHPERSNGVIVRNLEDYNRAWSSAQ